MNLDKALRIVDQKFSVPPEHVRGEFRDIMRRSAEEAFGRGQHVKSVGPLHEKDKLNEWINVTADKYLFGYSETIPLADVHDFAQLEEQLHAHFLAAMNSYFSEACQTLNRHGQLALVMHLDQDYENMKRGKLADISRLVGSLRKEAMKNTHGNITNNLTGDNARVSINSTDNSINIAKSKIVFEEVKAASEKIEDPALKKAVQEEIIAMETTVGKPAEFFPRYSKFISLIASHSTLFANLIPRLAELAG